MTSSSPHQNRQPLSVIEKLTKDHDPSSFDCGKSSLNDWLRRFALTNQQNDSARTYVLHRAGKVVGYYSLSAGSVRSEESPRASQKDSQSIRLASFCLRVLRSTTLNTELGLAGLCWLTLCREL